MESTVTQPAAARTGASPRRRAAGRPGHHPALDRGQIAATARTLLERDGFDAFSMRKLAASLGVKSPSLYWHLRSKDDLFDLIIDDILGQCRLPPPAAPGEWKASLTALGREVRRVLLAHPACGPLLPGRITLGPSGLRLAEYSIATLRGAGFNRQTASDSHVILTIYTMGFAAYELSFGQGPGARLRLRELAGHLSELPAGQFPHLTDTANDLFSPGLTGRFELGLTSILNGFELGQPHPSDATS